jgi:hypothetical protein
MYDILCNSKIFHNLPIEIINYFFPYVPFANITNNMLDIQKKRIKLYKCIKKYLYIEDNIIRNDIFKNYNGETQYIFENEHYFIFIKLCYLKETLEDYFALSF